MKHGAIKKYHAKKIRLYIPHGSDETPPLPGAGPGDRGFISHTVQMKLMISIMDHINKHFFVSHTVQMKPNYGLSFDFCFFISLYPTRFR